MYKIENQIYSDRFIRRINKCLKMFYDNFSKDEYIGRINYYGYGNATMYMDILKIGEEETNRITFTFDKYNTGVSSATINGVDLSWKERYKFNNSLIGTCKYQED